MVIRVVKFSSGGTKLERFLPNNQHTQRKLLNFENWYSEEVSKSDKIQLSKSKIIGIFLNFFSLQKYQFRGTFFVIDIF